jgi:hypothetical protein
MNMLKYELLADNPEVTDRLGFEPMAGILVDVIRETNPPFTIGIFGEWGSGKTTLMTLVQRELDARGAKTVWFNAWKYDGKEVIWNALIQTIFLTMKKNTPASPNPDFGDRVKETAGKLAIFAAKKATEFIPGGMIKPEDVDTVLQAFRPLSANDSQFEFINRFEETFDGLVKEYVGEDGRLVVFVDDLDRCLPENAIQILEAIKLYLDRANVTFVIGAERAIIEQGIRERYKGNVHLSAKEYLEKIVQLPFVMRRLSNDAALGLMAPHAAGVLGNDDSLMSRLILIGTDSNPRRIKRFINTYHVLTQMSERAGTPLNAYSHQLTVVLLAQMRFPEIYDELLREPGLITEFHDALAQNVEQRDEIFRRREPLRRIYEEPVARRFFEATKEIDCSRTAMERWVLLARGIDTSKTITPERTAAPA